MAIKNVDAKTLKKWLENDEAVIVDVREPAEHSAKNISAAKLLPLGQVNLDSLPKHEGKKLVLHCHSGKRSSSACAKLLQENPDLEVYNLEGGISAWSDSGCDTKESGKFFLPLDRQVQLTIGLGVLTGSFLGFYIDEAFFLLSGFFGAGLIFAGLTGTCGLAILMAKMPWNKACGKTNSCQVK